MPAAADVARLDHPLHEGFQKAAGGQIRFVFGSGWKLARQIGSGAPYDVHLSANERFVHDLAAQGKLDPDSLRVYALG